MWKFLKNWSNIFDGNYASKLPSQKDQILVVSEWFYFGFQLISLSVLQETSRDSWYFALGQCGCKRSVKALKLTLQEMEHTGASATPVKCLGHHHK